MKRRLTKFLLAAIIVLSFSSCAKSTVYKSPASGENATSMSSSSQAIQSQQSASVPVSNAISSVPVNNTVSVSPQIRTKMKPFSKGSSTVNSKISIPATDTNLMANIRNNHIEPVQLSDNFTRSAASFSIDLFKNSVTGGKSSLISPLSVYLALGMVENGAKGTTKTQFENVLGKYGLNCNSLNPYIHSYLNDITTQKYYYTTLNIANSIWIDNKFTPKTEFLQKNADYFGAGVLKTDFSNPKN